MIVPGAMEAGLGDPKFWWCLGVGLAVAFVVAPPLNRWLISRGLVDRKHRRDEA